MRVALEVWSSHFEQVESTCLTAEALGIDAFYYGESPHDLNLDCWTTLAALARSTGRIRIGPVITNVLPTYRSTALLARQATTVAAIVGGRLDFRTGVGASAAFARPWWEPFGIDYPPYDRRLRDLRDALDALAARAADETIGAGGSPADRSRSGRSGIPVTIAAQGDRAMELAGRYGDVWETSFCTPSEFAERRDRLLERSGGRTVECSLEIDGFLSQSRRGLDRLLARVDAERGVDEDLRPILDRALVGLPEDAAGRLGELADVGVDQVVVALHDPNDLDALHAVAELARILRER